VTHRREVTQTILDLLPAGHGITIDQAIKTWYYNLRETGGFRLTSVGYIALKAAAVQSWSVEIRFRDLTKKSLLTLDRKLQWPYYIDTKKKQLVMFSGREALMATLYNDVRAWLDSFESYYTSGNNH
jgi:hypothetical protein